MSACWPLAGPRAGLRVRGHRRDGHGRAGPDAAGGLQVPADIALAGFDDILTLRDIYPPLTTVRLPLKRMGEMAAGLVLAEPAARRQPWGAAARLPAGEVVLREQPARGPRPAATKHPADALAARLGWPPCASRPSSGPFR